MNKKIKLVIISFLALPFIIFTSGFLIVEKVTIPVKGASKADWAKNSFWFEPWGASGVHKGIDIFAPKGTDLLASVDGIVIKTGVWRRGGKHIMLLGPKWRIHYYAHLDRIEVKKFDLVKTGQKIGTVGDSGNAKGKPPHLHYTIKSLYPRFWAATNETQGARKMYYLDPHKYLIKD